jgi:ketosteroid isomerase-like protein
MGEARQVMDAATEAAFNKGLAALYAADAVLVTPDQGELRGGEQIARYFRQFIDAFPDGYELLHAHESGDSAIDEGYFTGTNTAPLPLPSGESMPATGKRVRVRGCDVATVQNGVITSHRLYFNQMEFLGQLGLAPETPS